MKFVALVGRYVRYLGTVESGYSTQIVSSLYENSDIRLVCACRASEGKWVKKRARKRVIGM